MGDAPTLRHTLTYGDTLTLRQLTYCDIVT